MVTPTDEQNKQLAAEFSAAVEIPKTPMEPQTVIAMIGLVGSGKTTISRGLCEKLPLVYLRTDDMRTFVTQRGYDRTRIMDMAFELLIMFLKKGQSVILDADCVRFFHELTQASQEHAFHLIWLHVATQEQEILHRLRDDNEEREYKGQQARDKYFERKAFHKEHPMTFLYQFNTDDKLLNDQINQAVELIIHS